MKALRMLQGAVYVGIGCVAIPVFVVCAALVAGFGMALDKTRPRMVHGACNTGKLS